MVIGDFIEPTPACEEAGDFKDLEKYCCCAGDGGGRDATGDAIGTEFNGDGMDATPACDGEGIGCDRGVCGVCGCCGEGFNIELAADDEGPPIP